MNIILITAAITLRDVLDHLLLLLRLPVLLRRHLPPPPPRDLAHVLEEKVVARLRGLGVGVVALAAGDAAVVGHVDGGGVRGARLLRHQLHDHLVAEVLQRRTGRGSATTLRDTRGPPDKYQDQALSLV